jgi:crotonobetainyl-CoA:carnitine CoA-transferase CaiB-like acyl-CoA transferase
MLMIVIVARISAFGQNESKMKFIPAHDMNSLAYAGIFGLSGLRKPMPIQAVDLITGYTCAAQIIAAIHQRSKGMILLLIA